MSHHFQSNAEARLSDRRTGPLLTGSEPEHAPDNPVRGTENPSWLVVIPVVVVPTYDHAVAELVIVIVVVWIGSVHPHHPAGPARGWMVGPGHHPSRCHDIRVIAIDDPVCQRSRRGQSAHGSQSRQNVAFH